MPDLYRDEYLYEYRGEVVDGELILFPVSPDALEAAEALDASQRADRGIVPFDQEHS